jgi:hypothetical protein
MGTPQRSSHGYRIPSRIPASRRREPWWSIVFAIPLTALLSGTAAAIWATYHSSRSVVLWNIAALLVIFGFAIFVLCLGIWVARGGHLRASDRL